MPGFSEEGIKITLSFCPMEYRRDYKAKIIIETELMQWVIVGKGELPVYNAPRARK
jgi:hypothetical protein